MERIWLKNYPAGVPAEINPDSYSSLVALFDEACELFADRPALSNFGTELTYAEFQQASRAFAAYLQHELGVQKGDRVAIMLPNLLQYPVAIFATLYIGAVVVNVNPLYTAAEIGHQLNDADAKVVIALANQAHVLQHALPDTLVKHVIITQISDMFPWLKAKVVDFVVNRVKKLVPPWSIPQAIDFRDALQQGRQLALQPAELTAEDIAFLQYTGGTTGVSKGAVLTHRNLVANVLQAEAWMSPIIKREHREIVITALPLYHVFSLTANCLTFIRFGGLNVLVTNPRDMPSFIKEMGRYPFTTITGVNTLFNAMMNHPKFSQLDFSHLKFSLGGGMATQQAVADRWHQMTGCLLLDAYGLTETSPAVTINPPTIDKFNGTIGLPISSTIVSIRDDDGQEVPLGENGELCVEGPQVMREYWQRPKETANVFWPGHILRTGDIGCMDEQGFVQIKERKKDMIVVSGFNVYPNEIEGIIAKHPGVLEVAVIGVPSERTGEAVKAFIVKKDDDLTSEKVRAFCKEHLTAYKVPKLVEFRESLPKSNVGKILRRALRDD